MEKFKPSGRIINLGFIIMDILVKCEEFPQIGETLYTDHEYLYNPGGKGSNQAVAASRLGGNVKMLGKIARDQYAQTMLTSLKEAGVDTNDLLVDPSSKTGVAFVWVNKKGENQIICSPAVNSRFTLEDLNKYEDCFEKGDIFVTTLEYDKELIYNALRLAKEKGCLTIVDSSSNDYCKLTPEIAENIDILKPNEVETKYITGIDVIDLDTAKEAINILKSKGIKSPIITLGKDGAAFNDAGGFIHKKGLQVEALDTTAAGDTFIGALATRLSKGDKLKDAVGYANLAASFCVQHIGAQISIPYKSDIEKLI